MRRCVHCGDPIFGDFSQTCSCERAREKEKELEGTCRQKEIDYAAEQAQQEYLNWYCH